MQSAVQLVCEDKLRIFHANPRLCEKGITERASRRPTEKLSRACGTKSFVHNADPGLKSWATIKDPYGTTTGKAFFSQPLVTVLELSRKLERYHLVPFAH